MSKKNTGFENGKVVPIGKHKRLDSAQGRWTPRTPDAFERTWVTLGLGQMQLQADGILAKCKEADGLNAVNTFLSGLGIDPVKSL